MTNKTNKYLKIKGPGYELKIDKEQWDHIDEKYPTEQEQEKLKGYMKSTINKTITNSLNPEFLVVLEKGKKVKDELVEMVQSAFLKKS